MRPAAHVRLRLAELIAALSLAIDLGLGQPMSHVLRTCLFALRLGRAMRLDHHQLSDVYYTTLLRFVGCTADSHDLLAFTSGDDVRFRKLMVTIGSTTPEEMIPYLVRFLTEAGVSGDAGALAHDALESPRGLGAQIASVHCEVATMLAARVGLGEGVRDALGSGFERWDGRGFPGRRAGDEIPLPVRIAALARDVEVLSRSADRDQLLDTIEHRRGHAHDPHVVDALRAHAKVVLEPIDDRRVLDEVLAGEPGGPTWVADERIDTVLTAFADFADAKTPFTLGHSRGVAHLAARAASSLGWSATEITTVRRAALLHDIGRSGIPNAIWESPRALTVDEWERVRLHSYYTERILARCEALSSLGALAAAHHERLDGSGYHKGTSGAQLGMAARVLAAADACDAMLQARPHRPALTRDAAIAELRRDASAGRLDPRAVEAVAAAAGAPALKTAAGPANLTEREIEVLKLMAHGHSNRVMAQTLGITAKTVGHHVQHIYDKIGVSTRAAAAVFAVEHQLI